MLQMFARALIIAIILIATLSIAMNPAPRSHVMQKTHLVIGSRDVLVDKAETESQRVQGLSNRQSLEPNTGMLFIFDSPGRYGIWMKDMHFPIDIIWVDQTLHIAGIERNVPENSYPKVFYPPQPILYVIETPANYADMNNIVVGNSVDFKQ